MFLFFFLKLSYPPQSKQCLPSHYSSWFSQYPLQTSQGQGQKSITCYFRSLYRTPLRGICNQQRILLTICYSLDLGCPPKKHVLKDWSPPGAITGKWQKLYKVGPSWEMSLRVCLRRVLTLSPVHARTVMCFPHPLLGSHEVSSLCHMLSLPWYSALPQIQSNGDNQPWSETSKAISK